MRLFILVCALLPLISAQTPAKFVYGGDTNLPPYEYLDAQGHPQGFNVHLVQAISQQIGIPIEIHLAPWRETIAALAAGRVDFASLSYDQPREATFDFLPEHWTVPQDMIFKSGRTSYPGEINQLSAETIAVEEGAMMHELLRTLPAAGRPALRPVPSGAEGLRLLEAGEVTAVTGSGLTLRWDANQLGITNLQSVTIKILSYRFATRKGNGASLAPVAAGVEALKENGKLERLVEEFLTIPPRPDNWRDDIRGLAIPLSLLLAAFIAIFAWNRSLRWQVATQTQELRMNESQFRDLAETLSVGILIYRGDKLLFANQIFRRMFGDAIPPARESGESQVRTLAGEERWVQSTAGSAIFEGALADVVTIQDVTERKHAEDHLRHAQRLEAVGKLAGGVAHDFNNLLTVIKGYITALRNDLGGVTIATGLREIDRAADRAAALTRQLLAFSRRQVLQPTVLNLNDVVSSMDQFAHRLIGDEVELRIALAPDLGRVKADQGQLEQVLMNLLVNARDAMPAGGIVALSTGNLEADEAFAASRAPMLPGAYVKLTVADNGHGMDNATIARIFEPFFTTKDVGKGTGLGLSMVYGIVKQSEGYIWASSELNKGTIFEIYLPRVSADETALVESTPDGETILVVEDEEALCRLIDAFLVPEGYRVLCTSRAEAPALGAKFADTIHLLITDATSNRLAERLQQDHPGLGVLFISGDLERDDADVLLKPFSRATLLGKVREILDRAHA